VTLPLGLEAPAPDDKAWSVTELVTALRNRVNELPVLWVEGEVSGFKKSGPGHWYFTLKDRAASISCMIWSDDARRMPAPPEEGMKVFVHGRLAIYVDRGQLQFTVKQLLPRPEGGFHALKIERARQQLEKDGLFAPERKRALPRFPSCIGVVTSAEGAAWPDIVAVVRRRWPHCELVLIRTRVQGDDAPRAIIRALALANRFDGLDLLIVGRGGGSKEDLSAFNDEHVARAVAASRVPTISAVGHEIDTTLTDMVADLRAPTPSAAAEKAVPDRAELRKQLDGIRAHLTQAAGGRVRAASSRLQAAGARINAAVTRRIERADSRLRSASQRMASSCEARVVKGRALSEKYAAQLDALSPLKVLDRGYAVARDDAGHVLKAVADFPDGKHFRLRVTDGEVRAEAES
jgi:exodeoxyribonuclease VII large subunit